MSKEEIIQQIKIALGAKLLILLLLILAKSISVNDNETDVNISNMPNVNITNMPNVNITKMPNTDTNITNQETHPVPVKIITTPPISIYKYYVRWACYQFPKYTVIDIQNPQSNPVTINRTNTMVSKIDQNLSFPLLQLSSYTIQSNNSVEITCDSMRDMHEIPSNPVTGFMIINSSQPLNVIGTYITDTTQYSEIILPNNRQ